MSSGGKVRLMHRTNASYVLKPTKTAIFECFSYCITLFICPHQLRHKTLQIYRLTFSLVLGGMPHWPHRPHFPSSTLFQCFYDHQCIKRRRTRRLLSLVSQSGAAYLRSYLAWFARTRFLCALRSSAHKNFRKKGVSQLTQNAPEHMQKKITPLTHHALYT